MKVKDLLKDSTYATIVTLTPDNLKSVAKSGVVVDVFLIDGKPFCGISTCERYLENDLRLNLALFPIRMSFTTCQVVNVATDVLFCLGYMNFVNHVSDNR